MRAATQVATPSVAAQFDATLGYPGEGPVRDIPLRDRLTSDELCNLLQALELVELAGVQPSITDLNSLCKLINKQRPEVGSRRAAWGAALYHLQPHLYKTYAAVRRRAECADRTLREYVQAWYGIDWDMLRELQQRANAASAMAQLSSPASAVTQRSPPGES